MTLPVPSPPPPTARERGRVHALAVAGLAVAVLLRWLIDPLLGPSVPFITVFGAVTAAVVLGGLGPGLVVSVLGFVACDYLFVAPRGAIRMGGAQGLTTLLAYFGTCAILVTLGEATRHAKRRLERAEALSRQRADLLHTTFDSIGDAVVTTDADGRVTYLNPVAVELTGWGPADAKGRLLAEVFRIFNETTREPVENPVDKVLRLGRVVGLANHTVLVARDGTERPIDDSAAPIRGSDGRIVGVVLVFHDVTERRQSEARAAAAAERFRLAAEAVAGLIYDVDWTTGHVERSRGLLEMIGHRPDEVPPTRQWWEERIHPDDRERLRLADRRDPTAESARAEYRVRHRDGRWLWVEDRAVVVHDPAGRVTRVVGCTTDVTERKRHERDLSFLAGITREFSHLSTRAEILALAGARVASYLEVTCCFFAEVDPERGEATVTDGWHHADSPDLTGVYRLAEWGTDEALRAGLGGETVVVADTRTDRRTAAAPYARLGLAAFVVLPFQRGDVVRYTLNVGNARPRAWDVDEVELLRAVGDRLFPRLERAWAEEEARESEERLRLAILASGVATWDLDLASGRSVWSDSHFTILGYEPAPGGEATFEMWRATVLPEDLDGVLAEQRRAEREHDVFRCEHRVRRVTDGRILHVRAAGRFFYDETGKATRFVGAFFDLSAEKQAVEALRDTDRRKDEFLATLAHELRNPLAPVRNAVRILELQGARIPEVDWAREVIDRQMQQMTRLVDDLLDVSRITRGAVELRKERVELAAVVRAAIETSRPLIESAEHTLALELPTVPVYLDADAVRLSQVFANILNNAARYSECGGRIRLSATVDGGHALVRIADHGLGIPHEMLPRVFDLFTQVDRSLARSSSGLGIGLTLVKRLVELHGGTVEARSEGVGLGSEFVVRLPLAHGDAAAPSAPAIDPGSDGAPHRPPPLKVLVVDDNRDAADSLGMMLRMQGHEVVTAYDGEQALTTARQLEPDVVLLDIGLPRMSGYDVAREIRARPWRQGVVLIAVSGWGQLEDRRRSDDAGFDRHLVKPVDPDDLLALVSELAEPACRVPPIGAGSPGVRRPPS
ncbi:MAG: PAS domain S-box protein [Deltaproteobacteria bacterium]|nr:PAS domain S-box protein [Deltaproteobacteria bacterium]